jgi:hypothetical protein
VKRLGKLLQICLKNFGNEALVSSSSEYDINKKEELDSFKTEHTNSVSSSNKTLKVNDAQKRHCFPLKVCQK